MGSPTIRCGGTIPTDRVRYVRGCVPRRPSEVDLTILLCTVQKFWYLEVPSEPVYVPNETWEPPPGGIVAMALNGMPIYGAQEAQPEVGNAVRAVVQCGRSVSYSQLYLNHSWSQMSIQNSYVG